MAMKTQGTNLYFVDPADFSIVAIDCAVSANTGGTPREQIETTCLESTARTYVPGLATPGQATIQLNFDMRVASHARLFELANSTEDAMPIAVGMEDGTSAPTADSNGDLVLPTDRSWSYFDGYVADVPQDAQLNSVWQSTVSIQRSGPGYIQPKGSS